MSTIVNTGYFFRQMNLIMYDYKLWVELTSVNFFYGDSVVVKVFGAVVFHF